MKALGVSVYGTPALKLTPDVWILVSAVPAALSSSRSTTMALAAAIATMLPETVTAAPAATVAGAAAIDGQKPAVEAHTAGAAALVLLPLVVLPALVLPALVVPPMPLEELELLPAVLLLGLLLPPLLELPLADEPEVEEAAALSIELPPQALKVRDAAAAAAHSS